jgi:cytochrome c
VTLDEHGDYLRMEPFLDHLKFVAPTDMQFATDGALYILEYGTNWFAKNSDARLIRVEYAEGNRKPVANITVDNLYGAVPFEVKFSAAGSKDHDENDRLQYSWQVEGKQVEAEQLIHTFVNPGIYEVMLKVKDNHGEETMSSVRVKAGNAPPAIDIKTTANRTFYWDNIPFPYQVQINDQEDDNIDMHRVNISLNFLPQGKDLAVILTNPDAAANIRFIKGQGLVNGLDCKACHSLEQESVGPAYKRIAERYAGKPDVSEELVRKIIDGGSGNWGQRPMSSHPDLSVSDAREMVAYILSLSSSNQSLPLQKTLTLKEHTGKGKEGSYLLLARYTDEGANGIEPLYTQNYIALRNPLIQVEDFDEGNVRLGTVTSEFLTFATGIRHESFIKFTRLDLSQVKQLQYRILTQGAGGNIEVRIDSRQGRLISTQSIPAGRVSDLKTGWQEVRAKVNESVSGTHDVYFVFTNSKAAKQNLFNVDWIYFDNKN